MYAWSSILTLVEYKQLDADVVCGKPVFLVGFYFVGQDNISPN